METINLEITYKEKTDYLSISFPLNTESAYKELSKAIATKLNIQNTFDIFIKYIKSQTEQTVFFNSSKPQQLYNLLPFNPKIIIIEQHQILNPIPFYNNISNFSGNDEANSNNKNNIDVSLLFNPSKFAESHLIVNNLSQNESWIEGVNKIFTDFLCTNCKAPLTNFKYICSICDNTTLCNQCESQHFPTHPVMKYKSKTFSNSFNDIVIWNNFRMNSNKSTGKVTNKEISWDLMGKITTISVRPQKRFSLPIIITNNWSFQISKEDWTLFIRNYSDLKVNDSEILSQGITLNAKQQKRISIEMESPIGIWGERNIEIIAFNTKNKTISNTLWVKIIINDDMEDEKWNEEFNEYEEIKILGKKEKQMIKGVLSDGLTAKSVLEVYNALLKNNWDLHNSIDDLIND